MWLDGTAIAPGRALGRVHISGELETTPRSGLIWVGSTPPPTSGGWEWAGLIVADPSAGPGSQGPNPPPAVGGLDADLFRPGEQVTLDGSTGRVELSNVTEVNVVTAFLQRSDGRILLLRRSERVGSFRGHWAAVSGFLDDPLPEAQARREIAEETGLSDANVTLARTGACLYVWDGDRVFTIHPFRFTALDTEIRLDWEHTEFEWVDPMTLSARATVPKLERVWAEVRDGERAATPRPVANRIAAGPPRAGTGW